MIGNITFVDCLITGIIILVPWLIYIIFFSFNPAKWRRKMDKEFAEDEEKMFNKLICVLEDFKNENS